MDDADCKVYPRLSAYVAALPERLASYPECQAKASLARQFLASARLSAMPPGLPTSVDELIRDPPQVTAWIPEARLMGMLLAIADVRADDRAFIAWMYDANRAVLKSPWYSVLMAVSSPMMLLKGTEMRWGALHKGTQLTATKTAPGRAEIRFAFPPALYTELLLLAYAEAFRAALDLTHARDAKVTLREVTAAGASYTGEWG